MDELNKKIALWCGFVFNERRVWDTYVKQDTFKSPDGEIVGECPNFLDPFMGIANLMKWAVPKLQELGYVVNLLCNEAGARADIDSAGVFKPNYNAGGNNPAEALAQAISKYIDSLEEKK